LAILGFFGKLPVFQPFILPSGGSLEASEKQAALARVAMLRGLKAADINAIAAKCG
jgi:hypothetical protein